MNEKDFKNLLIDIIVSLIIDQSIIVNAYSRILKHMYVAIEPYLFC
jgi:hypothetical protein